ncbi:MAG: hypothetical protein KBT11_10490 [Treponema sp.]|nr:hypothetical protein [Candidatus Treponema equifaecale]
MTKISGTIEYKTFAAGSKSESLKPFILLENGSQILLYKKNDNPFENKGFADFESKKVIVEGELVNGVFEVSSIAEVE